jgi:hypothetical protein
MNQTVHRRRLTSPDIACCLLLGLTVWSSISLRANSGGCIAFSELVSEDANGVST